MFAIGRIDGFTQLLLILLIGLLHQRHTISTGNMVEPHFASPERTTGGKMLLGNNEPAIGTPARLIQKTKLFFRHLTLIRTIDTHDPDIVAATAIRRKRDTFTVRRKAWLDLVWQSFGNPVRDAARYGQGVDVAQQIKGNGPTIRANVKIHPGAFVYVDPDLTNFHTRRRRHIPFRLVLVRISGFRRGWEKGNKCS